MKVKTFTTHLERITNPYVHSVPKYVISTASMDMASVFATFWRTPPPRFDDVRTWPSPANKCVLKQSHCMKSESKFVSLEIHIFNLRTSVS